MKILSAGPLAIREDRDELNTPTDWVVIDSRLDQSRPGATKLYLVEMRLHVHTLIERCFVRWFVLDIAAYQRRAP